MKNGNPVINPTNVKLNGDGTFTAYFGSKETCGNVSNRLDVTEGWNLLMRFYRPPAQPARLQTPGPADLAIVFRQRDEQAAFQVKDDVPQPGPLLALGAAPPGHADQPRQFAAGRPGVRQRHQGQALGQAELTPHDQLDAVVPRRHMCVDYSGKLPGFRFRYGSSSAKRRRETGNGAGPICTMGLSKSFL